tara:strand:+ start:213 stop:596 length:384 start_codon:yes stop_codon:yes gene_type:complete
MERDPRKRMKKIYQGLDLYTPDENPNKAGRYKRPEDQYNPGRMMDNPSKDYVVKAGDTMSQIAHRMGTTLGRLSAANPGIKNLNKIQVGQKIKMSGSVPDRTSVYEDMNREQMAKIHMPRVSRRTVR